MTGWRLTAASAAVHRLASDCLIFRLENDRKAVDITEAMAVDGLYSRLEDLGSINFEDETTGDMRLLIKN